MKNEQWTMNKEFLSIVHSALFIDPMSTNVIMPSMGFDMTEGKVSRWLKNIGDPVARNETIGEIETEKATVDLTAPVDGVFAEILVQPGATVPVNTPIAVIAAQGEKPAAPAPSPEAAPAPQTAPSREPAPAPQTAPTERQKEAAPPTAEQTPSREAAQAAPEPRAPQTAATERQKEAAPPTAEQTPARQAAQAAPQTQTAPAPSSNGERIKASPLAKNVARDRGIDLGMVQGTGPNGRIIERDVMAYLETQAPAVPTAKPAPAAQPTAVPVAQTPARMVSGEQGLSKMRQAIARRLLESKQTIPHYYLTMEIFMAEAMKLREQLNAMAVNDAEKISVNDVIVAAAARTVKKFPQVNAYFKGDRMELHDRVNVGVAVSVEEGLLTPVLYDADQKSLRQIATETKELAARARANKMKREDLGPGTFTISNLGMYGIDEFAAIINPPESAILAVGAVKKVPVVVNDSIQIAQVMKVTLSADHRIVDGALGARFLQELKKLLENPINLVLS